MDVDDTSAAPVPAAREARGRRAPPHSTTAKIRRWRRRIPEDVKSCAQGGVIESIPATATPVKETEVDRQLQGQQAARGPGHAMTNEPHPPARAARARRPRCSTPRTHGGATRPGGPPRGRVTERRKLMPNKDERAQMPSAPTSTRTRSAHQENRTLVPAANAQHDGRGPTAVIGKLQSEPIPGRECSSRTARNRSQAKERGDRDHKGRAALP